MTKEPLNIYHFLIVAIVLLSVVTSVSCIVTVSNISAIGSYSSPTKMPEALSEADDQLLHDAQMAVISMMNDPDAAKFKHLEVHRSSDNQRAIVCGYVNSKNGYGGYAGFQAFISGGASHNTLLAEAGVRKFRNFWNQGCVKWRVTESLY